jgi:uncharacterized protein YjlB
MKKERINTNPHILNFKIRRKGYFPNNRLPVVIYKSAVNLPQQKNKAADIIQRIFLRNGWSNSWRNGIYDFHHYHSVTHECMGVCMGYAIIIIGGPGGRKVKLEQGDVIVLPSGTGHKCLSSSEDFLCVGAYPQGKDYDTNFGLPSELKKTLINIRKLSNPKNDPVFGKEGFLKMHWD